MSNSKKRSYVQFSKKVVVGVTIAVTVIVFVGVVLAYLANDIDQMTDIIKTYVQYDMVVFVAYSGNSMLEKWLVKRGPTLSFSETQANDTDDDQDTSSG